MTTPTDREVIGLALSLVQDLGDLMAESTGVAGLHQNGDVAPWDSITEGGEFGAWLASYDRLRKALDARGAPGRMPASDVAAQEAVPKVIDSPACACFMCTRAVVESEPPTSLPDLRMARMFLCEKCGNKRCPHAADHLHPCSGSNAPGQPGSLYSDVVPRG